MASDIITRSNYNLKLISFNMHAFHQGYSVIEDLIAQVKPDLFLLLYYKNIG